MKALRERIDRSDMQHLFGQILVPVEEVMEIRNGTKALTERKFFPGYVLVEMEMTDESWHLVKNTSKVTGFIGGTGMRPTPISVKEVEAIMAQMQEGVEKPKPKVLFDVGQILRVTEGPFADFNATVEEVNYDKSKLKVSVLIFGRATPVEVDFSQVEKV
ncbi:transcription termination/antitermination protein NusG [Chitinimonas naiadis]